MQLHESCHNAVWPFWQKIVFRFCFIFFGLYIMPFNWLPDLPVFSLLAKWYEALINTAVNFSNNTFFHIKKVLVMPNGSGDTSFCWAELLLYCWVGIIGGVVWSIMDRKRKNYAKLNYFFCVGIRYFLAFVALLYGIEKVYGLQMPFPNTSQLATPLGDLLPMRLSWFFIGYSTPYQFFSGLMEVMVGLLLIFKRTATFGIIMALVVFTNIMMLNLSYDIPVKLFSMRLVALSLVLLAQEHRRIMAFFVLNKEAASCNTYKVAFPKKWMLWTTIVLKSIFLLAVLNMVIDTYNYYKKVHKPIVFIKPFNRGLYNVMYTSSPKSASKLWQDIVFDTDNSGSVRTNEMVGFSPRYGRFYFGYAVDTLHNIISFNYKQSNTVVFRLNYNLMQNGALALSGKIMEDSVAMTLSGSNHPFQLAEKQFHWLSESNR